MKPDSHLPTPQSKPNQESKTYSHLDPHHCHWKDIQEESFKSSYHFLFL